MSYNHNSFMVVSSNVLSSEIDNVTFRLKVAENKLKDTLFIMPNTTTYDFDEVINLLPLFQLYTSGSTTFDNQTYIGESIKLHLKININYTWDNAEYPPRYSLLIKKNNTDVLFNIYKGIDDSAENMNKLFEDILIDLNNGDQITISLFKDQIDVHDTITLLKNSYISLGIV